MSIRAETTFSLKDQIFNAHSVGLLAARLGAARRGFRQAQFTRDVLARFPELTLTERIAWMVTVLESHLPRDFAAAREVLYRALPEPLDPTRTDDDFGQFIWVVPGTYVARHGCNAAHLASSLDFLREATMRFSSETALRPFLRAFPDETLAAVHRWTSDDNYHVRRLASEGIRPFLPWAPRAPLPPVQVMAVLDRLYADPTRYVTRSVANTLNDLSKIDPDLVLAALSRWRGEGRQRPAELQWMTRHALRTLLKDNHTGVLDLLGYPSTPRFRLSGVRTSNEVNVGGAFAWRSTLTSLTRQRLRIALRIHFLKANGRHSAKVFLVKDTRLDAGEKLVIDKQHPFKPITTRALYPGTHFAELVVNGIARHKRPFELRV